LLTKKTFNLKFEHSNSDTICLTLKSDTVKLLAEQRKCRDFFK